MNKTLAAAFVAAAAFGATVGSQIEPFGRAEAQSRPAVVADVAAPVARVAAVDPDRMAREAAPARRAVRVIPIYNLPSASGAATANVPSTAANARAS